MTKKGKELEFISLIKRDGSGTEKVPQGMLDEIINGSLSKREKFKLNRLSLSKNTWVASGFNSFVVKIKT